jgi:hypothetical protein
VEAHGNYLSGSQLCQAFLSLLLFVAVLLQPDIRQCLWEIGRRFGACFFGAGLRALFGAGAAGLRVFLTGAILWKLIVISFVFVSIAVVRFRHGKHYGTPDREIANFA